jgi:hypothetical protein
MTSPSLAPNAKVSRTALLLAAILPAAGLFLIAWLIFWFTSNHPSEGKHPALAPAAAETLSPGSAKQGIGPK